MRVKMEWGRSEWVSWQGYAMYVSVDAQDAF